MILIIVITTAIMIIFKMVIIKSKLAPKRVFLTVLPLLPADVREPEEGGPPGGQRVFRAGQAASGPDGDDARLPQGRR